MKNLVNMSVKGRMAETLLYIEEVFGMDEAGLLQYSLSRKDMAALTGTVYETVIRTLNELVKDGCISLEDRDIRILDADKMRAFCDHVKTKTPSSGA